MEQITQHSLWLSKRAKILDRLSFLLDDDMHQQIFLSIWAAWHVCSILRNVIMWDVQTIRTAFNIAIGSESAEIQRTAKNSLLQMLNTIVRRVTLMPLVRLSSTQSYLCKFYHSIGLYSKLVRHWENMFGLWFIYCLAFEFNICVMLLPSMKAKSHVLFCDLGSRWPWYQQ